MNNLIPIIQSDSLNVGPTTTARHYSSERFIGK
jgi:hypothetical protein